VADIRARNDLFALCAMISDVGTFDRMAEAMNYHMFQEVAVANNGTLAGAISSSRSAIHFIVKCSNFTDSRRRPLLLPKSHLRDFLAGRSRLDDEN
jgi:hypothetical protein